MIKEIVYNSNNEVWTTTVKKYDEAGNCTAEAYEINKEGLVGHNYKYERTYDEAGNLIELVCGSEGNGVLWTETYEYEKVTE